MVGPIEGEVGYEPSAELQRGDGRVPPGTLKDALFLETLINRGLAGLLLIDAKVALVDPKSRIHPELDAIEGDLKRALASTRNAIRSLRQLT